MIALNDRDATDRARSRADDWTLEPLDAGAIRRAIRCPSGDETIELEILDRVDSTNQHLLGNFGHRRAVLAEYQKRGRGRRGRGWIAPPMSGLCLSFGYRFNCGLPALGPLSLVAGVAAVEVVRAHGVEARLKWPNDLVVGSRKLGGLLAEIRGGCSGPCQVVLGVGINGRLPNAGDALADAVPDQPWTDLFRETGRMPARNRLAGELIAALARTCAEFEACGFAPFRDRWQALDALAGKPVRVFAADGRTFDGRASGVGATGALKIDADGRIIELDAGEVSVRVR
ncbi:MAG: biotin--[acetyl-CoA-carboxylase] ligase [Wenzhouxiangellaceae bacterium]|nr:biotin--[acetyl-CoA-carboxylase] ligase [Wenzhouxiangellaceae bacterium]